MSFAFRLPAHRRDELRTLARRSHQVVVLAALTGALTGLLVAGLEHVAVEVLLHRAVDLDPWILAVMPGVGLLVALGARRLIDPTASATTSDEYLHAFHDALHPLPLRALVARMVGAVATVGSGVPMGLEGPSIYAGATIGSNLQRRMPRVFRRSPRPILMVAGAAAGVAATFKAPATGAVFALEVPYQDDLARRMLLPALVASATGYLVFAAINGTDALFPVEGTPEFAVRDLLGAALVGVLAGIGARGFSWLLRRAKRMACGPHPLPTTVGAGVAIGILVFVGRAVTDEALMVGPGYEVVAWATAAEHGVWVLLAIGGLRCLATVAAVVGGGVGGLFIPLVVAGALSGAAIGHLVDDANATLFVVIGVAAFLGAGYRVPLAAVMFVAETTGRPSFVVPGLLAAVAAELMMGHSSVTVYQRHVDDPGWLRPMAEPAAGQ